MGLLNMVVGGLLGGSAGGSPIQGALMNMLGGGQAGGQNAGFGGAGRADVPSQGFAGGAAGAGGLGGLVSAFEQAGLGHIVQSWIGNGANLPVTPQQLRGVLGNDQAQAMASQSGMPIGDFLQQLAQHLPHTVNGITPNGRVEEAGTVEV